MGEPGQIGDAGLVTAYGAGLERGTTGNGFDINWTHITCWHRAKNNYAEIKACASFPLCRQCVFNTMNIDCFVSFHLACREEVTLSHSR